MVLSRAIFLKQINTFILSLRYGGVFIMASKGQKFKKYSKEQKQKIILEKVEKGVSYSELASRYQVPQGTVITWVHQYRKNGGLVEKQRGRQKNDAIDYKERYEILKKFQDFLEVVDQKKK